MVRLHDSESMALFGMTRGGQRTDRRIFSSAPQTRTGTRHEAFTGYEPGEIPISPERDKNVSGRRRSCTSTVLRHAWHPWELIPTLSNAPPRSFHPSIQESTSGIHHSYSGLSAILNFSHVGENVRSVLAANQYITDFLPFALHGTFVRLPQA